MTVGYGKALIVVLLALVAGVARADGALVALLPLDADRSLELYGQPIANEISRTLNANAIQVVVVGPKMAVPEGARLIVDGTIAAGKAGTITISIRVRNPSDGRVLGEALTATAPGLAKLDAATTDLATRLLPVVQAQLAALRPAAPVSPPDHGHVTQRLPSGDRTVVFAIGDEAHKAQTAALAAVLEPVVSEWTRAHHRLPQKIEPAKLDAKLAVKAVGTSDFAIGLWVISYEPEVIDPPAPPSGGADGRGHAPAIGGIAMARAKVRVRVAGASGIVLDRVIVTDTVVGDRGLPPAELAARVSREVLAILRPHLLRRVRAWE